MSKNLKTLGFLLLFLVFYRNFTPKTPGKEGFILPEMENLLILLYKLRDQVGY